MSKIQVLSISNLPSNIYLFHYVDIFSTISDVLYCGVSILSPEYYLLCVDNTSCLVMNNFMLRDKKISVKLKNVDDSLLYKVENPTKKIIMDDIIEVSELRLELSKYVDFGRIEKCDNKIIIFSDTLDGSKEIFKYLCGRWYNKMLLWCYYG